MSHFILGTNLLKLHILIWKSHTKRFAVFNCPEKRTLNLHLTNFVETPYSASARK